MKAVTFSLLCYLVISFTPTSLVASEGEKLPSFAELHPNVQADILDEIGTRPMIVEDITDLIPGFDGSYIGLYTKNGKTYSFRIHVVFATQGGTGALITESKEVKNL